MIDSILSTFDLTNNKIIHGIKFSEAGNFYFLNSIYYVGFYNNLFSVNYHIKDGM